MATFAVIDDQNVINVILANSKEDAELLTGKTCIEYTTESAEPGGTYENGRFIKIKPYPSWILNDEYNWQPPIPYPNQEGVENPKIYIWDENTTSWVEE